MLTLFDEYDPVNPSSTIERLCRDEREGSTRKVSLCAGIYPGKEGNIKLYLSDLFTGQLSEHYIPKERLRDFEVLIPDDLNDEETRALDQRAGAFAEMCIVFAKLVNDPNAGKGPEHFPYRPRTFH